MPDKYHSNRQRFDPSIIFKAEVFEKLPFYPENKFPAICQTFRIKKAAALIQNIYTSGKPLERDLRAWGISTLTSQENLSNSEQKNF